MKNVITFFKEQYATNTKAIESAKKAHDLAQQFVENLHKGDIAAVKSFLGEQNKGATNTFSRTICLMDATGSMSHLLHKAKNTVGTMFERATDILKDNGIADCFQIQFAVYRDYDCKVDGILQVSPWETKPDNLRAFMEKISAHGGDDYEEAIEIGLWHANEEAEQEAVSQVILIGDAPAKLQEQINAYRIKYGGESYWSKTKFKSPTFYAVELQKLKEKKVLVHAFFVAKGAETNFREIASQTGGRCQELDINSSNGAQMLTDLVTEEVLRNIGNRKGKGNELVEAYTRKYGKSYK